MWKEENDSLTRIFEFRNFQDAFAFMTKVAMEAEKMNHHPDWSNSYNKVTISLSTHSEGKKVTEKDYSLSKKIDALFKD